MAVSQEKWAHRVLSDDTTPAYVITPKLAEGLRGLGIEVDTSRMSAQDMWHQICNITGQLEPMMDKNDPDFKELLKLLHGNNPEIRAVDNAA